MSVIGSGQQGIFSYKNNNKLWLYQLTLDILEDENMKGLLKDTLKCHKWIQLWFYHKQVSALFLIFFSSYQLLISIQSILTSEFRKFCENTFYAPRWKTNIHNDDLLIAKLELASDLGYIWLSTGSTRSAEPSSVSFHCYLMPSVNTCWKSVPNCPWLTSSVPVVTTTPSRCFWRLGSSLMASWNVHTPESAAIGGK